MSDDGRVLSVGAILGLEGSGPEWARIQGQHYAVLADKRWVRAGLHALGVLSLSFLFFRTVDMRSLAAWGAGVIVLALHSAWIDWSLRHSDIKGLSRLRFVHHSANALAKGLA